MQLPPQGLQEVKSLGGYFLHLMELTSNGASMRARGLGQVITGFARCVGHICNLLFSLEQEECDLRTEQLTMIPLSRTDHYLLRFRLTRIL